MGTRAFERLTSRQREVLALLREGLTNEEIAQRLGISADGVKYHVSDILRRLGVESRYEAAQWQPQQAPAPRRWAVIPVPFGLFSKLPVKPTAQIAGAAIITATAVVIGVLAWGVLQAKDAETNIADGLASGRIVAYYAYTDDRVPLDGESGAYRWRVGAYDAERRRRLGEFEVGTPDNAPFRAVFAGDRIVVGFGHEVRSYRIDGSDETVILHWPEEDGFTIALAASHDGSMISLTRLPPRSSCAPSASSCEGGGSWNAEILFIRSDGTIIRRVSQATPDFEDFRGQMAFMHWLDDDSGVVVDGVTNSDAPGSFAIVRLDGTVVVSEIVDYTEPSPDGRYLPTFERSSCPGLELRRHGIEIRELETNQVVATVADEHKVFSPHEWSPDSTQLLFGTVPYPGGRGDERCQWSGERAWSVLHVVDGTVEDGVDPLAIRQHWYDGRAPEFVCSDGRPTVDFYCYANGGSAAEPRVLRVSGDLVVQGEGLRVIRRSHRY